MSLHFYRFLFVLSCFVLTGCAGGPEITGPPTELSEINRVLESSDATIVWRSGGQVKDAEYARGSPDSIRYRLHTDPGGPDRWDCSPSPKPNEKTRSRSIHDVQRIVAHVGGGGGFTGLAIGAAPGGILAGSSFLSNDDYAALGVAWGGALALVGGFLGAIVGEFVDQDRQVVYQYPVDQYLMR